MISKKVRISLLVEENVKRKFKAACAEKGYSMSEYLIGSVEELVEGKK